MPDPEAEDPQGGLSHRLSVTIIPLPPRVLADFTHLVTTFAAGPHEFGAFRELWHATRFSDIFATARSGNRVPGIGETAEQYVGLLLGAAMRRLQRASGFGERLGALFLLHGLHSQQPCQPRVPILAAQDEWPAVEELERELRAKAHAAGFQARHAAG